MKKLNILLAVILVGIGVALTYHVFENAVHKSVDVIWYDWFDTQNKRWLVIPITVVISLIFFGLQHFIDRPSEKKEEHGLGEMPTPNVKNYLKILLIGYFSLIAGASLGPEAILVPACMLLGAYVGVKMFNNKNITQLLAAAGIMALFTAFFSSFIVGVLSIALVVKQAKTKPSPLLLIVAIVASASSYLTLKIVSGKEFFELPKYSWSINIETVVLCVILAAAGYVVILGMDEAHKKFLKIRELMTEKPWWQHSIIASLVIAGLYLIGGNLVQFTGNQAIIPMFKQAASLGLIGLIWILVIKVLLISWSKAAGYRGGMIFPTVFLAAVLVAILQLYEHDLNLIYGLIAVLAGAFIANSKTGILA
jgi:H+/Cl- antiporter ClcA